MDETPNSTKRPYYLFLFAIYPSISLVALNIRETDPFAAIRSLLISLILALLIYLIHKLFLSKKEHAYILTTVVLFLFFNYGHFYNILLNYEFAVQLGFQLHYLLIAASLIIYLIAYRYRNFLHMQSNALTGISIVLLIIPLYQIAYFSYQSQSRETTEPNVEVLNLQADTLPDIYYIIPDQYGRADTLLEIGYDNTQFIDKLRELGFFVADCSQSNYRRTSLSLASSLNLDFIFNLFPDKGKRDDNPQPVYNILVDNLVRNELEKLGYQTIAFQSGYKWGEWRDADMYLKPKNNYLLAKYITPFEFLLLKTTALKFAKDFNWLPFLNNTYMVYGEHYERVHFVLNALPDLASLPGPKFVYAHILIPHNPYIFLSDGSINPEGYAMSWKNTQGYISNVKYINNALEPIIKQIIEDSENPPIIIIQGDHGMAFLDNSQVLNLNAYYLPGIDTEDLHSSITPVNTFRLIFNQYFGENLSYRPNVSFANDIGHPYSQKMVYFNGEISQCDSLKSP
jgi:hypothetical protein